MLVSQYLLKTLRESPSGAELPSHIFLLRGGYIKQLASGLYSTLPLGKRVLNRIEALIRDGEDQHLCCVNVLTFDPRHTLSPAPLNPLGERYYLAAVQPSPHLRRHFFCEHLNSPLPFADTIHSLSHLSMSYRFCCIAPSVHGRMAPS